MHSFTILLPRTAFVLLFAAAAPCALSQTQTQTQAGNNNENAGSFHDYLSAVEQNNLDLQQQRETIVGAQAGVSIAGIRPDPQFTAGIDSKELYGPNKPNAGTTTIAGLAFTIETAGKRDARIRAAESNVRLTGATAGAFRRQLLADSASAFIEACRSSAALQRHETSLSAMRDIVRANEIRFKTGDIGKLELTQSKVEADRFGADVVSARADAAAAQLALSVFLGQPYQQVLGSTLACDYPHQKQEQIPADIDGMVKKALESREDILLAKSGIDNASDNVGLARANRSVDPVINVGIKNTPRIYPTLDAAGNVTNTPAEHSNSLGLTVTIPIPLSRLQSGELIQAQSALTQAQLQLRSIRLKAEAEVRTTYGQYAAATQNLQSYRQNVLADTDSMLAGVRLSYRKGSASLLDLLNAQRTADDVYLAYLQALSNWANASVKLQQSTGQYPEI
ncbi:TolC family protein [Undibacterium sp.]|uniref:TolC family protein n=1 Tax=Undibacterium sp. TaxID=1914977 RepID=UPI00374DFA9D